MVCYGMSCVDLCFPDPNHFPIHPENLVQNPKRTRKTKKYQIQAPANVLLSPSLIALICYVRATPEKKLSLNMQFDQVGRTKETLNSTSADRLCSATASFTTIYARVYMATWISPMGAGR
jgi:hypothetical protein